MDKLLGGDAVLMVPAAPGPAPKPNVPTADLNNFRTKLVALTSIAGLGRLPQVRCTLLRRQQASRLPLNSLACQYFDLAELPRL